MQEANELVVPSCPYDPTRGCGSCLHYLKEAEQNYVLVVQPNGQATTVPLAAFIGSGQRIPPDAQHMRASMCTLEPTWILRAANHWCGQYMDTLHYDAPNSRVLSA